MARPALHYFDGDDPFPDGAGYFCARHGWCGNLCPCFRLRAVDWAKPLETSEESPRPVTVVGETKGAIDYVTVEIGAKGGSVNSLFHHPPGTYAAAKISGHIRGNLAVRNKQ